MSIGMYTLPDKTPPLDKIHLMAIPYFMLACFTDNWFCLSTLIKIVIKTGNILLSRP